MTKAIYRNSHSLNSKPLSGAPGGFHAHKLTKTQSKNSAVN